MGARACERDRARSARSRLAPLSPPRYERKDHFHQRAKSQGFRSRAAYKLLEIQEKKRLLRKGDKVVDLGCWPGGWLQVASAAVGPKGRVVGVDRAEIDPAFENANIVAFMGDLSDRAVVERIVALLGSRADVLLCDAAPKLTGVRDRDRALEEELLLAVNEGISGLLEPGGSLLLKVLQGPEAQEVERVIRKRFETAKQVKAVATRKGSSERYLLGCGFKA